MHNSTLCYNKPEVTQMNNNEEQKQLEELAVEILEENLEAFLELAK